MALILLLTISVYGQQSVSATGGNASGTGGTVSYTIGQVIYTTISSTSGSLTHGVQQPYEISVVTGLEEDKDISLQCTAYPNPATDFLTLKVDNSDKNDLSYQLYDIRGNLIETKEISASETRIAMGQHTPGTYILKITSGNKYVKIFKIIKK